MKTIPNIFHSPSENGFGDSAKDRCFLRIHYGNRNIFSDVGERDLFFIFVMMLPKHIQMG